MTSLPATTSVGAPARGSRQRVIVLGALSTIAEALGRALAADGAQLALAARGAERLEAVAADLRARGAAAVTTYPVDLAAAEDEAELIERMRQDLGGEIDAVVVIYGYLGDQRRAETDAAELARIIDVNFTSAARWCVASANLLARQRHGLLLAVSSVAGDRGRQSNYVYGAAKAGLTVLVQGIAHRLAPTGARAVAVKLGFVDTAMTAHIPKGGPLWAKPDAVAAKLKASIVRPGKPVSYMPAFWWPIMTIIKSLPPAILHRTKL